MTSMTMFTMLGLSCVVLAVCIIAFSRYRHWLVFMGAGVIFWAILEVLRIIVQSVVDMSLLYAYVSAFLLILSGLTVLIVWYDKQHPKAAKKVKYIEHTPVYEDDRHHFQH